MHALGGGYGPRRVLRQCVTALRPYRQSARRTAAIASPRHQQNAFCGRATVGNLVVPRAMSGVVSPRRIVARRRRSPLVHARVATAAQQQARVAATSWVAGPHGAISGYRHTNRVTARAVSLRDTVATTDSLRIRARTPASVKVGGARAGDSASDEVNPPRV